MTALATSSASADPQIAAYGPVPPLVSHLTAVSLDEVVGQASLQTRTDRKYVVDLFDVAAILRGLGTDVGVLEMDGRRDFRYDTVYFDTEDLATFRHHVQGRRHRAKVRTRLYADSGDCMLEVKVKSGRGQTVKHRMDWEPGLLGHLGPRAAPFLQAHAPWLAEMPLQASAGTSYVRTTLLDRSEGSRATVDAALMMHLDGRRARIRAGRVLVETKSAGAAGPLDRALRAVGARPVSISKYCLAVPLLHEGIRGNRWNRILRRDFAWRPAQAA